MSSLIHSCVVCRRLRRGCETQKMADLPTDRLSAAPPSQMWDWMCSAPGQYLLIRQEAAMQKAKDGLCYSHLNIRAIHIEVIESLNTSSFINVLRRFLAIRGPVKQIRSDRGTNFVGACKDLQIPSNVDEKVVKQFLSNHSCIWKFNPPHSSHMSGTWERMIGLARRILDSMLLQMTSSKLTHEVLTTFMAEVKVLYYNSSHTQSYRV